MADEEVGKIIAGRYEIVRKLGEGGMGAVYQCKQLSMDRMVALKLIHHEVAGRGDSAQRFHREMKTTSKVNHENTIQVFDFGESDGQLFLAMEFLDGKPLTNAIAQGPMDPARIVHIGAQIARALTAAHAEGIVHRDLKPDNIMLVDRHDDKDVVKVLDFGIARFFEGERAQLTADGALVGTPVYMSPEQAGGRQLDHRSDLYSLGCILYQMASGRVPFQSTTLTGLLVMHLQEAPQPIAELRPQLPEALSALIMQLLAKSPDARPATAKEVADRLQSAITGAIIPGTRIQARPGAGGNNMGLIAAIGGLVLAGVGAAVFVVMRPKPTNNAAARAKLEAAFGSDPLAPAACQTIDAAVLARLDKDLVAPSTIDALEADVVETSAEYWGLRTNAALKANRALTDVAAAAKKTLELCPTWPLAHHLVGNAERKAGNVAVAETEFRAVMVAAPEWGAPRFNLALVKLMTKQPDEAILILDALITKNPNHPNVYKLRARAQIDGGHPDLAKKDLEEALKRAPGDSEVKQLLAGMK